jgi:hypothetical protein
MIVVIIVVRDLTILTPAHLHVLRLVRARLLLDVTMMTSSDEAVNRKKVVARTLMIGEIILLRTHGLDLGLRLHVIVNNPKVLRIMTMMVIVEVTIGDHDLVHHHPCVGVIMIHRRGGDARIPARRKKKK